MLYNQKNYYIIVCSICHQSRDFLTHPVDAGSRNNKSWKMMLFHGRRSLPLVSRSYFSFCWGASTSGSSRSFFSVAHSLRIHRHRRQDYFCHDHTTLRRHSLLQDRLCHALAFSASGSSLSRPLSPPQSPTPSS